MLLMKTSCERCLRALPPDSDDALICSYECTFCRTCNDNELHHQCPNCKGPLVQRPVRATHSQENQNRANPKDISLRDWLIDDLDTLVKYADNLNISRNMTDSFPHPYTKANGKSFIEFATTSETSKLKAILYKGDVVGGIGLHAQHDIYRKNMELGYWLAEPFWGQGIMTEAIRQMCLWGFENLEVSRIFARPFGHNKGSQKALEHAGFALEAIIPKGFYKNDNFVDEYIYGIRRNQ